MGIFNSFRQHIYRFFSKEEKEESSAMQPQLNKRVLQIMKRFGSKTPSNKGIEFFFYTDEENKANNLAIELNKLGYEVYGVSAPREGINDWSVIGCTGNMSLNEKDLNAWSQQMIQLGYECDCKFDGWGTLID